MTAGPDQNLIPHSHFESPPKTIPLPIVGKPGTPTTLPQRIPNTPQSHAQRLFGHTIS